MKIRLLDFLPEHALTMTVQAAQPVEITPEYAQTLAQGPAITGMMGDVVLFCAGKTLVWKHRWLVWALLSDQAKPHMLAVTRVIRRLLAMQKGAGRMEAIVRTGFREGCRWAALVGFEYHHFEERFLPDGGDAHIYVRFC